MKPAPRGKGYRKYVDLMIGRRGDALERLERRMLIARFMVNNGLRGRKLRQAVRNFEHLVKGG